MGLGFLFLLAGYELELHLFRERPGRLALVGWLVTAALACGVVGLLAAVGVVRAFVPVALDGSMLPENGAALVGAGVLSVLVFPSAAVAIDRRLRRSRHELSHQPEQSQT